MIWSRLALLMATPHLDPLPFTKGSGGPVDPKLTINEQLPFRGCNSEVTLKLPCWLTDVVQNGIIA